MMRYLLAVALLTMMGCATAPDYRLGWFDTRVTMHGIPFDGECLSDEDYDVLEEHCPKCVEGRFNERTFGQPEVEEEPPNII